MDDCDKFDMYFHWKQLQKRAFLDRDFGCKSLFGNYEGRCFRGKGRMAGRDEGGAARGHHGATPKAFASRSKPDGFFPENPPGGGSFVRGPRWLVPYSPLPRPPPAQRRLAPTPNPSPQRP